MAVYYNEWEAYPAQWLRNLIAAGLLPAGDVDERSIVDVQPDDIKGYDQCHFFAGIGGWPLALRMAGWEDDRPVWTGSCPCQPLSSAGKRKGHADKRHLWPAFYRLIAECRPPIVFGEQVASKDGREWLAAVRTDLEALGHACGASDLPAASKDALHVRRRLWWGSVDPDTDGDGWKGCGTEASRAWDEQQFARLVQDQVRSAIPTGPLRSLDDGIPNRSPKLRAYGNAIVPQVAAEFIRAFMECRP